MFSSIKAISSKSTSQLPILITARGRHSNRQIKRIFKKNPAFHRVSTRNETKPLKDVTPPPPITLEPIFNPSVVLPNGWSQPPLDEDILQKREHIPFGVKRTGNKPNGVVGFLPVYSKSKLGGAKQTTIVKKITGDREIFLNELRAILSISADDQDSICVRASGSVVEVNGSRSKEIKAWLAGLGF